MSLKTEISFTLNGRPVTIAVPVTMKTLFMLRDALDLTGTKYACGEGECGACTVKVDGETINSCLMYAVDCDGRDIVTIEGLQTESHATGFCRSWRYSMRFLYARDDHPGKRPG